jgi:ribosome-binding factor A
MSTRRQERVSERIHEEICDVLQKRIRDPRLAGVTVTGVEVSPDLKMAKVFVSALGDRESRTSALQGLQHASKYIRRQLAQQLQMRFTPELRFALDESWEHGARIDELLEQVSNTEPSDEATDSGGSENSGKAGTQFA